jgi:hypothetical protein
VELTCEVQVGQHALSRGLSTSKQSLGTHHRHPHHTLNPSAALWYLQLFHSYHNKAPTRRYHAQLRLASCYPDHGSHRTIPVTRSIQDPANGLHRLLYALLARTRCVPDVQTSLRDTSEAGKASRRPSSNAAKSPANVLDPCEQQESSLFHVRLCSENSPVPGSTSRSPRSPLVTDVSRRYGPRAPDETADCR